MPACRKPLRTFARSPALAAPAVAVAQDLEPLTLTYRGTLTDLGGALFEDVTGQDQLSAPRGTYTSVSAGSNRACAIADDGRTV